MCSDLHEQSISPKNLSLQWQLTVGSYGAAPSGA